MLCLQRHQLPGAAFSQVQRLSVLLACFTDSRSSALRPKLRSPE
jgi:hypothetical protein